MLLAILLVAPFAAALLAALGSGRDGSAAGRLGLLLAVIVAAIGAPLVLGAPEQAASWPWFRLWGTDAAVSFALGSDGLTGWLVQLVTVLTPVAIISSREHLGPRLREFVVAAFLAEGLMIGALLARDLVLFYVCFEGMLIPIVVLMALFGGADRRGAALQFLLYTMGGSVLMLVAIWWLAARVGSTDIGAVAAAIPGFSQPLQAALFVAFALAFAVKVPLVPLHGWQARTYAECPAGGVVLLSGAMAKIGVYGFLRFVLPIFPAESARHAPLFIVLGLIGVIGGALLALRADDAKRLLAWSSLSHLGMVVVGIFTFSGTALNGAAVQMVAHGLSTSALFLLVGAVEARAGRRGVGDFGGIARRAPLFATLFVAAALASAALPGMADFVGEFLLLFGAFDPARWWIAAVAGLSTILAAVYLLRLVQRWLFGSPGGATGHVTDIGPREALPVAALLLASVALGFYPKPVIDRAGGAANALARDAAEAARVRARDAANAGGAMAVAEPTTPVPTR